jgi:RNA polymerase sigma-70 factor, ECF subfamily
MDNPEKRVLSELKSGSNNAFECLFKTYYDPLCRYAYEIIKCPHQSEDIVENLFVKIWEERGNLSIHTSFRSYLYRSTYNACLNVIRKKKSENKYKVFFIHHCDLIKSHDYGSLSYPLSGIIEREMNGEIEKVIEKLPAQCKKIFLMSRTEELPLQEIADRLGISVNTVKWHIMVALKKIELVMKELVIIMIFMMMNLCFI